MDPFKALLRSRKFWLAVLALVQTLVFQLFPDVDDAVWQSIDAVLVALIGAIAWEDSAKKRAGGFDLGG